MRKLRLALGLTQEELARRLSCSQLTGLRWENKQQVPRTIYRRGIAKLIRVLEREISEIKSA